MEGKHPAGISLNSFWGRCTQKISTSVTGADSNQHISSNWASLIEGELPAMYWFLLKEQASDSCSSYLQQSTETTEYLQVLPFVLFSGKKELRSALNQKISYHHTALTVNCCASCCTGIALGWKNELWRAGAGEACCCFRVTECSEVHTHDLDVFPGLLGKATNGWWRKSFLKHLWQLRVFLFSNV